MLVTEGTNKIEKEEDIAVVEEPTVKVIDTQNSKIEDVEIKEDSEKTEGKEEEPS